MKYGVTGHVFAPYVSPVSLVVCKTRNVEWNGLVEWTRGMDSWNGLVEWLVKKKNNKL